LIFISQANLVEAAITAPTDISDNVLWLDATDSSTLFTDAACSVQANTGDDVQCWKDKSSQAKDYKAINTGKYPDLLSADQNGKNTLHFNGSGPSSEGLRGDYQIPANHAYTKAIVFKYDSGQYNNMISSQGGTALYNPSRNGTQLQEYRSGLNDDNAVDTSRYYIAVVRHRGATNTTSVLNVDGVEKATNASAYGFNTKNTEIGSYLGGYGLNGKIAEAILYEKALTDSEVDDVECYLSDKWGIAVSHSCVPTPSITSNGGGDTANVTLVM
jgi:hypothetical protein